MTLTKRLFILIGSLVLALASIASSDAAGAISKKDYEAIKTNAYNEIRNAANNGSSDNLVLIYDITASFPKDLRKLYVNQVEYASNLYASFFPDKEVINIYLYTEKDARKIASHPILSRDSESYQDWFKRWAKGEDREHNLGLAASYSESENGWHGHAGLIVYSGATARSMRKYAIQVMPHEYFHVVQDFFLNKYRGYSWPSYDAYAILSPPTFREGSANTISFALASRTRTDYFNLYRSFISEFKSRREVKFNREMTSQNGVVKALKLMENSNNRQDVHDASYPIGQLLYEWVIAEYGLNGYRNIVENQIKYGSFSENVKMSLGIELEELYRKAAPHIIAALKYGY